MRRLSADMYGRCLRSLPIHSLLWHEIPLLSYALSYQLLTLAGRFFSFYGRVQLHRTVDD